MKKRKHRKLPSRGINDRYVKPNDFVPLFADIFDTLLYQRGLTTPTTSAPETVYKENHGLWRDVLDSRLHPASRLALHGFHVTEWIPSSPGRYFTEHAKESRESAQEFWAYTEGEYLPLGKNYMVMGGVGCLRLRGRQIDGQTRYLLGASASGNAHQGVPLLVPESEYAKVIGTIKDHGGSQCNIFGVLQIMPTDVALIQYDREVPRCAILVDGIEVTGESELQDLDVTVAIMYPSDYSTYSDKVETFSANGYETRVVKSWSYAAFHPDSHDEALASTVDWLRNYAIRYSGENVPILSDFDEHRNHFSNPTEFTLHGIQSHVDLPRVSAYGQYYNLTINTGAIVMGDVFQNISGSTIVTKSKVENSFNRIKQEHSEDVAVALIRLAEVVSDSGNTDAGELLDAFNDELAKEEPKQSLLRSYWDGLTTALPTISTMADVVQKLNGLFGG